MSQSLVIPEWKELPDEAATEVIARSLAAIARPGDILAMHGELGTGKTVFARAFIRARGGIDEEVPSPTFTLVQTYELPGGVVYHFDLYRLARAEDAFELDIEDAFATGISLIEWPDRLGNLLPEKHLDIELSHGKIPDLRKVRITGPEVWLERLANV